MSDNYDDRDELAKRMGFDSWEAFLNSETKDISEEEAKENYQANKKAFMESTNTVRRFFSEVKVNEKDHVKSSPIEIKLDPCLSKTDSLCEEKDHVKSSPIEIKLDPSLSKTDSSWKEKYLSRMPIPNDIIIYDLSKFENLKSKTSEELIKYRKENLRGLNEVMIALIDPEYYEAVRMIPSARENGNDGILPTQTSMRWREMNDEDILRLKLLVHPYSTLSDLALAAKKDFMGENSSLYNQIVKRGLEERIEKEANLDSLLESESELQIDNVPTHFYN